MLAEKLGQTVTELLTGEKQPLTHHEFVYWQAFWSQRAKYEEEATKKANKKQSQGPASQEFKRTMGPKD
jgi:hypothetical protein